MKKTVKLICLLSSAFIIAGIVLSGCKKDSSSPAPTASFSTSVSGTTVTITSTVTDASSYAWNFGDGDASAVQSTDKNPTHTYTAAGSYTIKLTATGPGGSVTVSHTVTIGPIVIPSGISLTDNSFADWDTVAIAWKGTDTIGLPGASTLQVLKLKQTHDTLFVYLETTSKVSDSTWVCWFFDTDNSPTTGYQTWMYNNTLCAFDYVYQGQMFLGHEQGVQQYTGAVASSNWTWTGLGDVNFTVIGHIGASRTTPTNTAIEYAYLKASMEGWDKKITVGIYESAKDWSEIGIFPTKRHAPCNPLVINLQ